MRHYLHQPRTNYMVPLEIKQGIQAVAWELARPVDEGGYGIAAPGPTKEAVPVRETHVACYVLARFLALPPGEQERFWREGKRIMDEHMAKDKPYPIATDLPLASEPGDGDGTVTERPVGRRRLVGNAAPPKGGKGRGASETHGDRRVPASH